ncbi:MAG: 4Fe-4S dicluster domain-containing protein [Deltaproteobacteria bacterium]|nr:4Fe-4S dicluster domain-containing protein [Deltaproteobacteria bacterium]
MNQQLAMVIDSSACIDCRACILACKVENNVPAGKWRNWVKRSEPDYEKPDWMDHRTPVHFQPGGCMHCEVPTCVQACPTGATYKDVKDGAVKVNSRLCIGCGSCIPACPYNARYLHPTKHIVDKCDYCQKRRERGELPACVLTCPTKARVFGDILDPKSDAALLLKKNPSVRVINKESDTKPNMYYLSATAPLSWPVKAGMPDAIQLWKQAGPLIWGVVGLNALGVLVMLGKQLLMNDKTPDNGDSHEETRQS